MKKMLITIIVIVFIIGIVLALITMISARKSDEVDNDEGNLVEYVTVNMTTESTEEKTEEVIFSPAEDTFQRVDTNNTTTTDEATDNSGASSDSSSPDKYTVNQNTEDTKAPVFLINSKNVNVNKGTPFDVHSYIGYADDVDRDVELIMDGSVNTAETGTYHVTITLKDDAGHTTSSDMTVNVNEGSAPPPEDDGPSTRPGTESFESFDSEYRKAGTQLGLDVSRWQGSIDFNKVKAAGCDFVILRIGGYDDNEFYTDRCYQEYLQGAKAAGLKVGVYWHAEDSTPEEARASVKYMLDVLDGEKLDFPIAYDWEDFLGFEDYKMNLQDINDCFEVFADEVEAAGYEACLYSSLNFLETVWTNTRNHKVWLAHYTSQTDYTGSYYMWQHTSSGKIDGVNCAVDFNVLYE